MSEIKLLIIFLLISFGAFSQNNDYYFSKTIDSEYTEVISKIKTEAKKQGFGVVHENPIHEILNEKLDDVAMKPHIILDLCNPKYAWESIQAEPNIGIFLPCKIVVKYVSDNRSEVVLINPSVTMAVTGNEEIMKIAGEVTEKLKKIFDAL